MTQQSETFYTIWDRLRVPDDHQSRRLAWRLLRQFKVDSEISQEFAVTPQWHWKMTRASGSEQERAVKLLLASRGGYQCETVVLLPRGELSLSLRRISVLDDGGEPPRPRATVCVSSQPGCGVGCPFCATGQLGYRGNLSAQEIIEQVYWAGVIAQGYHRRLRNVVFMGMGEPLHNLRAVLESLTWLTDDSGFGLSPRHITVSTAGVPGAMLELIHRFPRVRLALSLHAVDRQLRRRLVPRAVGDLHLLRTTIEKINRRQPHPVWLEIVLFAGVNDTLHHAQLVRDFSQGLNVEVNLIPYNSAVANPEFAPSPRPTREAFATLLRESGIRTTLRTSFGSENSAACGQLTTQPSTGLTHFDEAAGK